MAAFPAVSSFPESESDLLHFTLEAVGVEVCVPVLQVFPIVQHCGLLPSGGALFRPVCRGREPLALYVGLYPEVGEEEEEEDAIYPDEVDEKGDLVVALLHEVILADVDGDDDKLRL